MTLTRKPRIEAPFIIGRRKFLTGSAGLATFGLLAGCSGAGIDPTSLITQTATTATSLAETQSLGEKDEIQIGNTLYGRIVDSQGGYYRNAAVQAEMERFAAPLIATAQRQHLPWEIVVLDNNEVNAWALPGGKLGVDKGLLRYCASETDLVTVIGQRSAMPISAMASPRSAPNVSARRSLAAAASCSNPSSPGQPVRFPARCWMRCRARSNRW